MQLERLVRSGASVIALVLAGCAEQGALAPTTPDGGAQGVAFAPSNTTTPVPVSDVTLCKVGSSADFTVVVNHGTPTAVTLADGECRVLVTHYDFTPRDSVWITENVAPGQVLDSIAVVVTFNGSRTVLTGTNTVATFAGDDTGRRVTFYNTVTPPPPPPTTVTVCKVGTAATFGVTVNGGAATGLSLDDGECRIVDTHDGNTPAHLVTVTENVLATSFVLDSIVVVTSGGVKTVLTGVESATATADDNGGATVTFYNRPLPPPPSGGQGCTPGYWKQPQHFDSWTSPYTPTTPFSAVFEDAFPGRTLLDVLKLGGGGLNALGRHTVAALLNSAGGSGVNYNMSAQGVIDAFNAAYPSGSYDGLKNIFEGWNEQGCPLN